MNDHKIYLAGKVDGEKWRIKERFAHYVTYRSGEYTPAVPVEFEFLSSDHGTPHKPYDPPLFNGHGIFGGDKDAIEKNVVDKLKECTDVCAYIESADCYGTIAEIAFASALGKPVLAFVNRSAEGTPEGRDAYKLVLNLPGVDTFKVESVTTAAVMAYMLIQCESPIEKMFAVSLFCDPDTKALPVPQLCIGNYRVDFGYINERVAVELDGHDYHSSKQQRAYDAKRDRFLQSEGWKVIRFTGSEVWNGCMEVAAETNAVINKIKGEQVKEVAS